MNVQILEARSVDLRVLTDDELDNVNGGLIWFILGGLALVGLGVAAGLLAAHAADLMIRSH